ncbi:hypothetical protein LINGRAHAP2_LOCUS35194, partial [Linum grandiflorum]
FEFSNLVFGFSNLKSYFWLLLRYGVLVCRSNSQNLACYSWIVEVAAEATSIEGKLWFLLVVFHTTMIFKEFFGNLQVGGDFGLSMIGGCHMENLTAAIFCGLEIRVVLFFMD